MSKRQKNSKPRQAQDHFTRGGFEARPVTRDDKWCSKWCRFPDPKYEGKLNPRAPYGYLVIIPSYSNGMELDVEGYIIKSRLFKGTLFLQVATGKTNFASGRNYCTEIKTRQFIRKNGRKRSKKATARFLNIRNLDKNKLPDMV